VNHSRSHRKVRKQDVCQITVLAARLASAITKSVVSRLKCFGIGLGGVLQPKSLEINTIKRMKKVWPIPAIVLGIALLAAGLPTDISAGSKGYAFIQLIWFLRLAWFVK
jgi:hypothetical protein